MIGIGELIIILVLFLGIPQFILFIVALVDILKSEFPGNDKLIWILLIIFLPLLGPILYFLIGRKNKIQPPSAYKPTT
ncbi:MAG: PLDc N-terminal domain-containing protein [Candidatus Saccharicenans sp.]|nr:MAG: hypothetical protein C0168_05925 [Candidatus Aminicenantes bacterium]HEK86679.1 hypothetical protein [Candidatus Aminicenantes bacterium]